MKLNKKGLKRLLDVAFDGDEFYQSNALEVEFEPDDFESCVVLTVMEAKDVLHSLNCAWSRCPVKAECKDLIKKKIEQAEGKR